MIEAILPIYESGEAHGEQMAASVAADPVIEPDSGEDDDKVAEISEKLANAEKAIADLKAAILAKSEVEAETGDLGAMDSAEAYYKAGCAKFGIDVKGLRDSDLCATLRTAAKMSKNKIGDSIAADDL